MKIFKLKAFKEDRSSKVNTDAGAPSLHAGSSMS